MSTPQEGKRRRTPQAEASAIPKILLTEKEAAGLIGFTPRTLTLWRTEGRGPAYVAVSARAVRYRAQDLEAWAASLVTTPDSK